MEFDEKTVENKQVYIYYNAKWCKILRKNNAG